MGMILGGTLDPCDADWTFMNCAGCGKRITMWESNDGICYSCYFHKTSGKPEDRERLIKICKDYVALKWEDKIQKYDIREDERIKRLILRE